MSKTIANGWKTAAISAMGLILLAGGGWSVNVLQGSIMELKKDTKETIRIKDERDVQSRMKMWEHIAEGDKRCESNRNRITYLEAILKSIDASLKSIQQQLMNK